ncbi:MAG: ligase-associated DNA damage response endonuclease PdeM [Pseudomonadota bacterium]
MVNVDILIAGEHLVARPAGTLFWPASRMLIVGDLHLGRARGMAMRGQGFLPPYADDDTLLRLAAEIEATDPGILLLLGDSFDDQASADGTAAALADQFAALARRLHVLWVAGNHDPRPVANLPGRAVSAWRDGPLIFRHIASAATLPPGEAEISAHYHPQAALWRRGTRVSRRCFLLGQERAILPAFGTYTGGMDARDPVFDPLLGTGAMALLLGQHLTPVPRERLDAPVRV